MKKKTLSGIVIVFAFLLACPRLFHGADNCRLRGVAYAAPPSSRLPFGFNLLHPAKAAGPRGQKGPLYDPRNKYEIFINYELGMHCAGFDISYCCILPLTAVSRRRQ